MSPSDFLLVRNGQAVERSACPVVPFDRFRRSILDAVAAGARLSALSGRPTEDGASMRLTAVLARPTAGDLALLSCDVRDAYPSLKIGRAHV